MIRLPRYLDRSKFRDVAEYLGFSTEEEVAVEHTTSEGTSSRLGVNKGIDAGRGAERSEATVETYQVHRGPVQLFNEVVTRFGGDDSFVSVLDEDPIPPLVRGTAVDIAGELQMLRASEIAQYFDVFLPLLQTETDPNNIPVSAIVGSALSPTARKAPLVFRLDRPEVEDAPESSIAMILDPQWIRDCDVDDLEGPCNVFGVVDRLVSEGRVLPLNRYLVPQFSRAVRRTLEGRGTIEEVVKKMTETFGTDYQMEDMELAGPAALIAVVAIY